MWHVLKPDGHWHLQAGCEHVAYNSTSIAISVPLKNQTPRTSSTLNLTKEWPGDSLYD